MKILQFVAAFCAASLSMVSTALAASSPLITEFNEANVRQALEQIGATNVEFTTASGGSVPLVHFSADGLSYTFVYLTCQQGTGCKALNMTIGFEPGPQPYPLSPQTASTSIVPPRRRSCTPADGSS